MMNKLLLLCLASAFTAPGANNFAPTGNLNNPRAAFTLTRLNDGRVLAAGGEDNVFAHASLATSETYDAVSGQWSLSGNLVTPRSAHTATRLADGRILVAGGCASPSPCTALSSAEIYDPASGSWNATGSMKSPRYSHQASLLGDGRVLVTGGIAVCNSTICNPVSTAEIYNPETGSWAYTTPMPTARIDHASTSLPSGRVLIVGGSALIGNPSTNLGALVFDPASAAWLPTGAMHVNRSQPVATLLSNGKVLVTGGLDPGSFASTATEVLDPATNAWTATGNLHSGRFGHTATALAKGDVLVAGGNTQTAEIYNLAAGSCSFTGPMSTPRTGHEAALLPSGAVIVAGGQGVSTTVLQTSELYQPGAGPLLTLNPTSIDFGLQQTGISSSASVITVTNTGNAPLAMTSVTTAGPNPGDFQAAGCTGVPVPPGQSCGISVTFAPAAAYGRAATVILTNNAPDSPQSVSVTGTGFVDAPFNWQPAGNMTNGRVSLTLSLLSNGKVLAAGGRFDASANLYDPTLNTWTPTAAPKAVHTAPASIVLGGSHVLVTGGGTAQTEVFDGAVSNSWSLVGPMSTSRTGHALSALGTGLVLAAGGCNGTACQTAELYNPNSGLWTPAAPMGTARVGLTLTPIGTGMVLAAGGATAAAEIYNASSNQWTPAAPMSAPGLGHTATAIGNGKVLVVGGCSGDPCKRAEIYDSASNTWTPAARTKIPHTQHTATRLADGRVLVAGGIYFCDPEFGFCFTTPGAEVYNPATNSWQLVRRMIVPRDSHAAVLLPTGEVLVAGGENDVTLVPLASAETFRLQ